MTTVPARPAAYIRVEDATSAEDPDITAQRDLVVAQARHLGWPVPAVYADAGQAGQPGSRAAGTLPWSRRSPPAATMPSSWTTRG